MEYVSESRNARCPYQRYSRDGALVLGGIAAILLQLTDPAVASAVAAHSRFARDPVGRLWATLDYVYAIALGDDDLQQLAARRVDRMHAGVAGAADPEHQLWVAATLYRVGLDTHGLLIGPVPEDLAELVYARAARLGTALQVPEGMWPPTRAAFDAWWAGQLARATVTEDARAIARQLLHPRTGPAWMKAAMPLGRAVTAELLPHPLAAEFGLTRHPFAIRIARAALRLTPRSLRELPSRQSIARLRARAQPSA